MNYYAWDYDREYEYHVFDSRDSRDAWVAVAPYARHRLSSKDSVLRRLLRQEGDEFNDLLYYHYKDEGIK